MSLNNEQLSDITLSSEPPRTLFHRLILTYRGIIDNPEVFGFILLVVSQFFNAIMIAGCKLLVTDDSTSEPFHPLQILFVRMFVTYICCIAYFYITKSVPYAPFGEKSMRKWLVLRGVCGFCGVYGMYFSLLYLSVSDAVAITFLVPLVTAFLAFVVLRERYSVIEGICSLISLMGVVLIAKPHFIFGSEVEKESGSNESVESSSTEKRLLAIGVGLFGVLGASSVYIILRKIGNNAHALLSVSYFALTTMAITSVAIAVLPSVSFLLPHNKDQWILFLVIGISGFVYQFALTTGVQRVSAGKASLVIYTQMIFAIIFDIVIWSHLPGFLSVLGIFIIIGSTLTVMKYKPSAPPSDIEQHEPLYDDNGKLYEPEDIQMDEFVIDDDPEETAQTLNSLRDSPSVKMNI